ncbi:hypothetical protein GCM10010394_08940 [Streptomyces crystallinus]|uniref:Uncharacterized protein n=1 Tax=Streptomyces crystallinus TaxID=68191 RepID=A0ABP3Q807_9ACTN
MLDEGVDAAEAHGGGDERDARDHGVRVAVHLEGDHRPAHRRVVHPGHPGVVGQAPGQLRRACGCRPHPYRKRRQAPQQQIAGERVQDATGGEPHLPQLPRERVVAGDHAAHDVTMAAQVLGGAVQHDLGAQFPWPLEHGRGEGVVDEQRHRAARVGDGPDVHLGEGRVGRGLHDHQTGVGPQRVGDARGVDPGHLRTEESGVQEVVAAAVQRPDGDHVPQARRGPGEQHRGEGGHAAGEGHGAFGAFQPRERCLETAYGGVVQACVHRGPVGQRSGGREGIDPGGLGRAVVRGVGRREVDRRGVQSESREVVAAGVDGFGGQGTGCGLSAVLRVGVHGGTVAP